MKGSQKQIKWAEDIKLGAILAAGNIVKNAEADVALGFKTNTISVEVAKELEQIVISGFEAMDNAAEIIDKRHRFTQSALESLAKAVTRQRANKA